MFEFSGLPGVSRSIVLPCNCKYGWLPWSCNRVFDGEPMLAVVGPKLPEALTIEPLSAFSLSNWLSLVYSSAMLAFLMKAVGDYEILRRLSLLLFFSRVPGILGLIMYVLLGEAFRPTVMDAFLECAFVRLCFTPRLSTLACRAGDCSLGWDSLVSNFLI